MTKPVEREVARQLRSQGMSYKRIAAELEVSPSSAFNWTSDIELTPEQLRANLYGPRGPQNPDQIAARVAKWKRMCRERRAAAQREGRERARLRDDWLHQAGCMLYWAEGSKGRNTMTLCNSDPHMLAFFRRFLIECLAVNPEDLRLRLHVYLGNGLTIEQIENYWLKTLGLPATCLRGHSINPLPSSSSGRKKNKLPYGVCSLSLGNTSVVQHIYGAIQEYAGFDEPRWLD